MLGSFSWYHKTATMFVKWYKYSDLACSNNSHLKFCHLYFYISGYTFFVLDFQSVCMTLPNNLQYHYYPKVCYSVCGWVGIVQASIIRYQICCSLYACDELSEWGYKWISLTGNFNFAWKMRKTKIQEHRKLRNLIKNKPMFLKMQKKSPFSWSKISRSENLFLHVYFLTVFFSFNPSKKGQKIIRTTPFFYWTQLNIIFSY